MISGGTKRAEEKRSGGGLPLISGQARAAAETERTPGHLTKHVEADFLGLLARLVLGGAGVFSFVHLLHVLYHQLGAVLIQAVLVSRLQHGAVAATEEGDGASAAT